jgi:hypothetical protein
MAKKSTTTHLYELAKRGAEVRARFLADELRLLFAAFPHLEDAFDPDELPIAFIMRTGAERQTSAPPRKRRPMSPAARQAAADRMKRYWASRKAGGDT